MRVYAMVKDLTVEITATDGETALRYSVGNAQFECSVDKLQELIATVLAQAFEIPMPEQQQ